MKFCAAIFYMNGYSVRKGIVGIGILRLFEVTAT
jgi:hypothetical protein